MVFVFNAITLAESSPEKAGVGGSIPSLATTFSITYKHAKRGFIPFHSKTYCSTGLPSWGEVCLEGCSLAGSNRPILHSFPASKRSLPAHTAPPEASDSPEKTAAIRVLEVLR